MTPIVLHHGLLMPGNLQLGPVRIGSFVRIAGLLAERGFPLVLTQVHPTASVARRASQLKQVVLEQMKLLDTEQVIVFAHSMGGLDARHMISHLGMARHVAALVTISTPHRGSPYADWVLRHLTRFKAMQLLNLTGLDLGAAISLTRDACAEFNEHTPDAPEVKYFSISAARPLAEVSPLLYQPWLIVNRDEGANDGLVSTTSARWGNHLETWPADHLHVLNRRFVIEWKNKTGDIRPYYVRLLDHLARAGALPPEQPNFPATQARTTARDKADMA